MKTKYLLLGALIACISSLRSAAADSEIYKWTDDNGVAHYTSTKPAPDAKPAKLPEIMRGEYKVPAGGKKRKVSDVSCERHGGVNCQAGRDADGSVICSDGFKGSVERFKFSCSSPRLVISDISEINGDGGFSVFVRNSKSVAADGTRVEFHPGSGRTALLNGPPRIKPYGIAEYKYLPEAGSQVAKKPVEAQITVKCDNCG